MVIYKFADAGWLAVSKVGLVHVVFFRKNSSSEIKSLVTDEPDFSAKQVVAGYDGRWMIEVFNKDAKQHLRLGQYQNLRIGVAVIHLQLVCFAYALLTHLAITVQGDKGKQKSTVSHSLIQSFLDLSGSYGGLEVNLPNLPSSHLWPAVHPEYRSTSSLLCPHPSTHIICYLLKGLAID